MLKVDGYDIYFVHKPAESGIIISEFEDGGTAETNYFGSTTCKIELDKQPVVSGTAFCSINDVFNKASGRKISLKRALEFFDNKEFRTAVWNEYIKTASHL